MAKISGNSIQLGDSATATQNFVLQTMLDGTAKLSRGNLGSTTQDVLTVDAAGKVTLVAPPIVPAQSMVRLNTANGYGSTNTKIRRFTNVVTNQGSDITYADSATLGASFTINTNGVYAISYSDMFGSAGYMGLSLNTATGAAFIYDIPVADRLCTSITTAAGYPMAVATTVHLIAGSIIRPHTDAQVGGTASISNFTITRVA